MQPDQLDDLYPSVDRTVVAVLIGGPVDGSRMRLSDVRPAVQTPDTTSPVLSNCAEDLYPVELPVYHWYELVLDNGHPSRTDDGAYRYEYKGWR